AFRVAPGPRCGFRTAVTSCSNGANASAIESVDPSSETIISRAGYVWPKTESTASPIVAAAWYAAVITLKVTGDGRMLSDGARRTHPDHRSERRVGTGRKNRSP